jgi:hypothetical protein
VDLALNVKLAPASLYTVYLLDLESGVVFLPLGAGGLSPSTDFNGHILTAGHLAQPATIAIGQRVMASPDVTEN